MKKKGLTKKCLNNALKAMERLKQEDLRPQETKMSFVQASKLTYLEADIIDKINEIIRYINSKTE